jgi:hypothetical protein
VEPQIYQNQLEDWIDKIANNITTWSNLFLIREIPRWTDAQWKHYDVDQRRIQLARYLDKIRVLRGMKEVSGQTIEEMAKTLEKSFWAEWIQKDGDKAVPVDVAQRLEELDILREAGTTISGFWHTVEDVLPGLGSFLSDVAQHSSTQEDQKLLAWAKKFKANFDKSAWSKLAA